MNSINNKKNFILEAMFLKRQPTSLSDTELLGQFKSTHDLMPLSELYMRYTSLVYGVCLKYLKDRDEAKDMVMLIYEKLTSKLKNHEVLHFKSWLYTTARNECLMQLRSQKGSFKEKIDPSVVESEMILHLEEEPEMEPNLSKLERCIEELVNEQKECVRLFFLQEKCYKEITDTTGFEMGKVKSYIQNGKRNLKICMEKNA
jgi:RNA polymerase sigma factor (sigma-70 family)